MPLKTDGFGEACRLWIWTSSAKRQKKIVLLPEGWFTDGLHGTYTARYGWKVHTLDRYQVMPPFGVGEADLSTFRQDAHSWKENCSLVSRPLDLPPLLTFSFS